MNTVSVIPKTLSEGRYLLERSSSTKLIKELGQCFTGLKTGRLLAALAVEPEQTRIIDPMAGHGDLLEVAMERFRKYNSQAITFTGVEIEKHAARLGKWRMNHCLHEYGYGNSNFLRRDAFSPNLWRGRGQYDLVIGNPPYVRYQTLSKIDNDAGSVTSSTIETTRTKLLKIAKEIAPAEEAMIWETIIRSYSGLSDLSVPSLLLCGLLTAPGGTLALVLPQTWMNREYSKIVQYFFLRFFQPVAVVQESGQRWFKDALVPVSLVVGKRLQPEMSRIPLTKRRKNGIETPFVEINPSASSDYSHVGGAFSSDDPEGEFAIWLNECSSGFRSGIDLKLLSWDSQCEGVVSTCETMKWFGKLENKPDRIEIGETPKLSVFLPPATACLLPDNWKNKTRSLCSEGVRTGQGLRTGCNAFFYVDTPKKDSGVRSDAVIANSIFGHQEIGIPSAALVPVLRKQKEISGLEIKPETLEGRLLDLRRFVLPENAPLEITNGIKDWNVMPKDLAAHIHRAASTYLIRGEKKTLIPNLSAVKPNGLGPHEKAPSAALPSNRLERMWYMIPDFTPRHLPALCIPRIIHQKPTAILNSAPPVLVDANFSSIWCESDLWCPLSLFAVFNSTWGEMCMESLGTTLGGGALKLEAVHLRQFPLPLLSGLQKNALAAMVKKALSSPDTIQGFLKEKPRIDEVILSAINGRKLSKTKAEKISTELTKVTESLRLKRKRNH